MLKLCCGFLGGFLVAVVLNPTLAVVQEGIPRLLRAWVLAEVGRLAPEPPLDRSAVPPSPLIGSAVDQGAGRWRDVPELVR